MSIHTAPSPVATPCTEAPSLYQHPLVEDGLVAGTSEQRRQQAELLARAETLCRSCPLMTSCLYQAVVSHNVSGIAGGTTPAQREAIRSELGIRVLDEDLDAIVGTAGMRQIDHHELLRVRASNPQESLDALAQRMGCSLSTIKRHLRKARSEPGNQTRLSSVKPSLEQVLHATRVVTGTGKPRQLAARGARSGRGSRAA